MISLSKMELGNNPNVRKKILFLLGILVFTKMLVLNHFTPLFADDLVYSNMMATTVLEALRHEYYNYISTGGRSVVHFILRLFLMMPKVVFNILNALVYTSLMILIYKITSPKKTYNISLFLFIVFAIWLYSMNYGIVILQLTGAVNYLWGTTIILSLLLPYCLYVSGKDIFGNKYIPAIIGMFFLGVLAGWCNENTSGGMILIISLLLIYCKIFKQKITIWMIAGLVGSVIGYLFMVLAPGYAARRQYEGFIDDREMIEILIERISIVTNYLRNNFTVLIIIFLILITTQILMHQNWKRTYVSITFFIASIATAYVMILSPHIPERTMFGSTVFMIIACAHCFAGITFNKESYRIAKISLILVLAFFFSTSFIIALGDIGMTNVVFNRRVEYIETQKAQGNLHVLVPHWHMPHIHARSPWNPVYNYPDFFNHPGRWQNGAFAFYHGLKSVWWENMD